eukprot:1181802-Prorocentrum_minimum.AAC.2
MEESPRTKHASAFPLAPAPAGAYINFIGRTLLPNIVASGFFCTRYTRRRDRHAAAQACARRAPSRCAKRCLECSARNTGNSGDRVFGSHHRCLECSARNTGNSGDRVFGSHDRCLECSARMTGDSGNRGAALSACHPDGLLVWAGPLRHLRVCVRRGGVAARDPLPSARVRRARCGQPPRPGDLR